MFTHPARRETRHPAEETTPALTDLLRLAMAGMVPAGFSLEGLLDRVEGAK